VYAPAPEATVEHVEASDLYSAGIWYESLPKYRLLGTVAFRARKQHIKQIKTLNTDIYFIQMLLVSFPVH
jgi:hypothetical protein